MTLPPGSRFGALEIVAPLGAGGMGEVYRARDTRLNREVAVKVLPAAFTQDAGRLARFTREAQTLAALNHPNIAHIHGIEESGAGPALVLELVDGEDLSVLIARGPMPLDEALPIARQIAEALEAAHEQGIVHRDLKPANVKVRADGTVKVLDFGLAKALDQTSGISGSGAVSAPTLTRQGTEAGMVLGTAAYMAPEQARGRATDRRADIWAFGVVLFEMLTGTQVFAGETISDTIAAVLTREPDWRALPATTPVAVRRLVQRCLERDVRRRLQAIGEARLVLESPNAVHDQPVTTVASRRPRGLRVAAAIAAGLVLFTAGWLLRPGSGQEPPIRKLDLALEGVDVSQGRIPAIAPDGSAVAFVAGGRLRVRALDRLDAVDLPDSDGALFHTWSPDSRHIAYLRNGRAWKVAIAGGAPVDLGAVPVDLVGSGGGAWTADGNVIFAGSDTVGLWAMPSGGGAGRDLLPLDPSAESDFHEIATLPDNRGLLFTVHRTGRLPDAIELLADGERRMVLELPGESVRHPVYSKTGHIIYSRETTSPGLWAVPFSLDRLETTGPPLLVVPGALAPTLAADGTICFLRPDDTPIELVRVSRSGDVEPLGALSGTTTTTLAGGPTGTGYQQWGGVSLSPDGGRVAVSIGFSPGQLTVVDLARGSQSIVATGVFPSQALWSRPGDVLLYGSSRDARAWNIWSRRADGAGAEQRITTSDEVQLPSALTPDGATLVYSEGSGPTGSFFRMPFTPGAGGEPLFPRRIWGLAASFSPDGRYIAYESPESGRSEVYVRPFPEGDQQIQVSTDGGVGPVWSKNGEIFYLSAAGIMAVSASTAGASATVSKPQRVLGVGGDTNLAPMFDVTADGTTFFMLRSRGRARVSLIFNWPRELLAAGGSR